MGLRAALRQDPDVILLGEMRDPETIEIALRAAQTGHLVFSTLHNMGAANSIYRIINSFESGHQNEVKIQLSSLLRELFHKYYCQMLQERVELLQWKLWYVPLV